MWIEILYSLYPPSNWKSRLARALWIEIHGFIFILDIINSRGSREPCGLKFGIPAAVVCGMQSRLARALWIEILTDATQSVKSKVEARESLVD